MAAIRLAVALVLLSHGCSGDGLDGTCDDYGSGEITSTSSDPVVLIDPVEQASMDQSGQGFWEVTLRDDREADACLGGLNEGVNLHLMACSIAPGEHAIGDWPGPSRDWDCEGRGDAAFAIYTEGGITYEVAVSGWISFDVSSACAGGRFSLSLEDGGEVSGAFDAVVCED